MLLLCFYRLYYKLFRKSCSTTAGKETFKEIEQTLDNYNKAQGNDCAAIFKTPANELVIAICTPLMKRVHARLRESSETVFVESPVNCGRKQHLFLLLAQSSVGALPLGVLITTSETQDTLLAAMQLLLTVFPPERFYYHPEGPQVFMTTDCAAIRQVLRDVFPKATLLYSVHHLLQAMFRWLWTSSNEVPRQHRTHLLKSYRSLLCAATPASLEESYIKLAEDSVASQHSKFLRYVQEVFTQREEWAICLNAHLSAADNQVNKYVESATKFAKEKVLYRLKSYSLALLVNFVVTRMEAHYLNRLTCAANSRLQVSAKKVVKGKDVERHLVLQVIQEAPSLLFFNCPSLKTTHVVCTDSHLANDVLSLYIVNTDRKRTTATLWRAEQTLHRPAMSMWWSAAARVQRECWVFTVNIKVLSPGQ